MPAWISRCLSMLLPCFLWPSRHATLPTPRKRGPGSVWGSPLRAWRWSVEVEDLQLAFNLKPDLPAFVLGQVRTEIDKCLAGVDDLDHSLSRSRFDETLGPVAFALLRQCRGIS